MVDSVMDSEEVTMKIKKLDVPFAQVANQVLNDSSISWKAKGLFAYIQGKPEDWDFASERMSKDSKDGIDGTLSGLKELEKNGYLIRKKMGDGRLEMELKLPTPERENPVVDPEREKASQGKSLTGKSPSISNKESLQRKNQKKERRFHSSPLGRCRCMGSVDKVPI